MFTVSEKLVAAYLHAVFLCTRMRISRDAHDTPPRVQHFINPRRACAARVTVVNPRRACAARVTVVGSVCVSVKSHLTYGASVRPENAVTYSAGNEGQKICRVFPETAPLQ